MRRAAADPARSPLVLIGALVTCLLVGALTAMPGLEVLPIALLALGVGVIVLNQPFYGLVIWLGVAPFASVRGSAMLAAAYDGMHRLLILGLVLVVVLGALAQRRSLRLGLSEALMALYALYTVGSLLSASGNLRGDTMTVYDRILLPFGAYFLARELVDRPARFQTVATVLIAVAALQGLISLGGIVPGLRAVLPAVWFHREDRLTGSLGNPAAFGATMVMILVLLNHARRYTTNPDKQVLIRVASLLGALSLLLTFSRSVWISAALVLLLSLRANRNLARSLVPIAVVTLAIVFSGLLARETAYANARLHNEETIYGRIAKIYASVHMWEVHPIFGWGYRQMDDHFDQYLQAIPGLVDFQPNGGSHNTFLTILVELGIFGLPLYLGAIGVILWRSRRAARRLAAHGLWSRELLAACWLAVAVHLWVSNTMDMKFFSYPLAFFWFTLGLIAALTRSAAEVEAGEGAAGAPFPGATETKVGGADA